MSQEGLPQSFANHKSRLPPLYVAAGVVLAVEMLHRLWVAFTAPGFWSFWSVLVFAALLTVLVMVRTNSQRVQDRVIRLEMRLRLERLLGQERRADIARLGLRQLIALRFASDPELPALFEEVVAGKLREPIEIKQRIVDWQADWLRV